MVFHDDSRCTSTLYITVRYSIENVSVEGAVPASSSSSLTALRCGVIGTQGPEINWFKWQCMAKEVTYQDFVHFPKNRLRRSHSSLGMKLSCQMDKMRMMLAFARSLCFLDYIRVQGWFH